MEAVGLAFDGAGILLVEGTQTLQGQDHIEAPQPGPPEGWRLHPEPTDPEPARVGRGVLKARILDPLEPQVHVEGGHGRPLDQRGAEPHNQEPDATVVQSPQ